MKNPVLLYEVSFFSALWMVFPESWKRSCPNFYAHDCIYNIHTRHNKPDIELYTCDVLRLNEVHGQGSFHWNSPWR